jgi:protease I
MAARKILDGVRVAILVADGFEQVELQKPRQALDDAGADTCIVSPADATVRGWNHHDPADAFEVNVGLSHANPDEFDALLLPGGVVNPDALRINAQAVAFVRSFVDAGKPIAAICHGPWTLIEARGVKDRQMTSWPSLHTDLRNAGAEWVDEPVVVDGTLLTSRKPDDIPLFNSEMLKLFAHSGTAHRSAAAST